MSDPPPSYSALVQRIRSYGEDQDAIVAAAREMTNEQLTDVMAHLGWKGSPEAKVEAIRDALSGILSARLTQQTTEALERSTAATDRATAAVDRLNASSTRLTWSAIGVAIGVAIISIIIALWK